MSYFQAVANQSKRKKRILLLESLAGQITRTLDTLEHQLFDFEAIM